ncbi:MAG: hypothetical protein KDI88_01065 [Gammaproteobacteria bacterium]|nr:hypothetical protein [Gammaproteobacteria bacterium]
MVTPASSFPDPGLFPPPTIAVARHPAVMLSPRQLKNWIGELPLANPTRATNEVLQQLRLLVRDPDPGKHFGTLLDLFAPPLEALLETVEERLNTNPDNAVPLDQLEFQLIECLAELAAGYIRIANDQILQGKRPAIETLYRAMNAMQRALHIKRLHYHQRTTTCWANQLRIFLHAENLGIGTQALKPPIRRKEEPATIRELFFSSLMVCLTDPNHRRPAEILDWTRWSAANAGLLQLSLLPQGAGAIPLDISGEMAPLSAARQAKPGPDTRYLDTTAFMQAAREAAPGLHRALSELAKGRRKSEQRKSPRQERQQPYRIVFGMREMYQRLNALTRGLDQPEQQYMAEAVQVNQSKDGAAFVLHGQPAAPLSVGEPLLAEAGTHNARGAPVGFTAIVQRFLSTDDGGFEIGVEKMRGRLIPVMIQNNTGERSQLDPHALLQQDTDTGRYLLLAARGWFRSDDHINVEGPSARYRLRLVRMASEMLHTTRIEVEIADD